MLRCFPPCCTRSRGACSAGEAQGGNPQLCGIRRCACSEAPADVRALQVERKAAIINFVAIAEAADGVILSRGNLGLDFDPGVRVRWRAVDGLPCALAPGLLALRAGCGTACKLGPAPATPAAPCTLPPTHKSPNSIQTHTCATCPHAAPRTTAHPAQR